MPTFPDRPLHGRVELPEQWIVKPDGTVCLQTFYSFFESLSCCNSLYTCWDAYARTPLYLLRYATPQSPHPFPTLPSLCLYHCERLLVQWPVVWLRTGTPRDLVLNRGGPWALFFFLLPSYTLLLAFIPNDKKLSRQREAYRARNGGINEPPKSVHCSFPPSFLHIKTRSNNINTIEHKLTYSNIYYHHKHPFIHSYIHIQTSSSAAFAKHLVEPLISLFDITSIASTPYLLIRYSTLHS